MGLRIGALARRTGATAATIRYYESVGLLPRPGRQAAGQREYGEVDVERLKFILRCRDFGFSINEVHDLVTLKGDRGRPCVEVRDMARMRLEEIRTNLFELAELERSVAEFLESCETDCQGGPGPDCPVLRDLAGPKPDHFGRAR